MQGEKKQVIYVEDTGSEIFGAAYLVLKSAEAEPPRHDLIEEANRIIAAAESNRRKYRKSRIKEKERGIGLTFPLMLSFLCGIFFCVVGIVIASRI